MNAKSLRGAAVAMAGACALWMAAAPAHAWPAEATRELAVREGPGMEYPHITVIQPGTVVDIRPLQRRAHVVQGRRRGYGRLPARRLSAASGRRLSRPARRPLCRLSRPWRRRLHRPAAASLLSRVLRRLRSSPLVSPRHIEESIWGLRARTARASCMTDVGSLCVLKALCGRRTLPGSIRPAGGWRKEIVHQTTTAEAAKTSAMECWTRGRRARATHKRPRESELFVRDSACSTTSA